MTAARKLPTTRIDEIAFTKALLIGLTRLSGVRAWRQNCGEILVRDITGKPLRMFDAGPPTGAADISGGVRPEGFRLEVELKMPRGKRNEAQLNWAAFCKSMGFVYALVQYDATISLDDNVEFALDEISAAIDARRRPVTA